MGPKNKMHEQSLQTKIQNDPKFIDIMNNKTENKGNNNYDGAQQEINDFLKINSNKIEEYKEVPGNNLEELICLLKSLEKYYKKIDDKFLSGENALKDEIL